MVLLLTCFVIISSQPANTIHSFIFLSTHPTYPNIFLSLLSSWSLVVLWHHHWKPRPNCVLFPWFGWSKVISPDWTITIFYYWFLSLSLVLRIPLATCPKADNMLLESSFQAYSCSNCAISTVYWKKGLKPYSFIPQWRTFKDILSPLLTKPYHTWLDWEIELSSLYERREGR